jgi:5-methylcytosine-specific restriction endonuclease McrA
MTLTVEKRKEYQDRYLAKNREKINLRKKARYYANTERILAANKKRRDENKEHVLEIERASRNKNKDKNRLRKNANQSIRNRLITSSNYVILYKDLKRVYSNPCFNCGSMKNQSLDHKIPLSKGGEHKIGNIMTLCQPCNASKHARTIMEWRLNKIKKGDD